MRSEKQKSKLVFYHSCISNASGLQFKGIFSFPLDFYLYSDSMLITYVND